MQRHITLPIRLMFVTSLVAGQNTLAATVYQWTDEAGVVQFSDTPPKVTAAAEIQEIEFVNYAENDKDKDEYSINNQLERMAEWRRQITEERMAKKQLQLEAQRIAQERNVNRYNIMPRTYYQPMYYYPQPTYYSWPGHHPGHRKWQGHHRPSHHSGMSGPFQFKSNQFRIGETF